MNRDRTALRSGIANSYAGGALVAAAASLLVPSAVADHYYGAALIEPSVAHNGLDRGRCIDRYWR